MSASATRRSVLGRAGAYAVGDRDGSPPARRSPDRAPVLHHPKPAVHSPPRAAAGTASSAFTHSAESGASDARRRAQRHASTAARATAIPQRSLAGAGRSADGRGFAPLLAIGADGARGGVDGPPIEAAAGLLDAPLFIVRDGSRWRPGADDGATASEAARVAARGANADAGALVPGVAARAGGGAAAGATAHPQPPPLGGVVVLGVATRQGPPSGQRRTPSSQVPTAFIASPPAVPLPPAGQQQQKHQQPRVLGGQPSPRGPPAELAMFIPAVAAGGGGGGGGGARVPSTPPPSPPRVPADPVPAHPEALLALLAGDATAPPLASAAVLSRASAEALERALQALHEGAGLQQLLMYDQALQQRAHILRRHLHRRFRAAVLLQSVWRAFAQRRRFAPRLRRWRAAIAIQRLARGRAARGRVARTRLERAAAGTVQRAVRQWRARLRLRAARLRMRRIRACQLAARAWLARREVRGRRERRAAATRMQAAVRGWQARRLRLRLRTRRDAATHVQRLARGWLARRRAAALRRRVRASVRLQSLARGVAARRRCRQLRARRDAAVVVQSFARMVLARAHVARRRRFGAHALALQRRVRGVLARRRARAQRARLRAATTLQALARGRAVRASAVGRAVRARLAGRRIAALFRGWAARRGVVAALRRRRAAFVRSGLEALEGTTHGRTGWYRLHASPNVMLFAVSDLLRVWRWRPLAGPMRASERAQLMKTADSTGVLQALPGTVQGSSGLYINKRGRVRAWEVVESRWTPLPDAQLLRRPACARDVWIRRDPADIARMERAALRLQRVWRGTRERRTYSRTQRATALVQRVWRGTLARGAARLLAEQAGRERGAMVALPRTAPGRAGWYVVDGDAFYMARRQGEWRRLLGPFDEEALRRLIRQATSANTMLPLPGTPTGRSGFYMDADTRVYLFDVDDKGVWTERPGAILLGADD